MAILLQLSEQSHRGICCLEDTGLTYSVEFDLGTAVQCHAVGCRVLYRSRAVVIQILVASGLEDHLHEREGMPF